eukprot:XP_027316992.1 uncharacterized protein LOC113844101 isoform X2 [Anas platyrhynchos]
MQMALTWLIVPQNEGRFAFINPPSAESWLYLLQNVESNFYPDERSEVGSPPEAYPGSCGVMQPVRDLQRVPGLGRPPLWMVCASQHA